MWPFKFPFSSKRTWFTPEEHLYNIMVLYFFYCFIFLFFSAWSLIRDGREGLSTSEIWHWARKKREILYFGDDDDGSECNSIIMSWCKSKSSSFSKYFNLHYVLYPFFSMLPYNHDHTCLLFQSIHFFFLFKTKQLIFDQFCIFSAC